MGEASAGRLLAAGSVVSFATRIVAGWVADRFRVGFVPVVCLLLLGSVGLVLLMTGDGPVFVAGALVAFSAGAGWPGLFHLAVVHNNDDRPGAASGVMMAGLAIGAATGPLLFGTVAELASFGAAWGTLGALAVLSALLILSTGPSLERLGPDPRGVTSAV